MGYIAFAARRCRMSDELPSAETALRAGAGMDLGDYFAFDLGAARALQQVGAVRRIPVTARLGASEYARFHATSSPASS